MGAEDYSHCSAAAGLASAVLVAAEEAIERLKTQLTASTDAAGRTGHGRYKAYRAIMERIPSEERAPRSAARRATRWSESRGRGRGKGGRGARKSW